MSCTLGDETMGKDSEGKMEESGYYLEFYLGMGHIMVLFSDLEKTEERTDLEIVGMKGSLCGILSLSCVLDPGKDIKFTVGWNLERRFTRIIIWKPPIY